MLNRFVVAKRDANRVDMTKRPYLASECEDVSHCEVYRGQILKELSKKVSLIQNEGLDEHRVRDLNDAINKLIREKGHWERQIKKLGGARALTPSAPTARRPPPPPPSTAPPPQPRPAPPHGSTLPPAPNRVRVRRGPLSDGAAVIRGRRGGGCAHTAHPHFECRASSSRLDVESRLTSLALAPPPCVCVEKFTVPSLTLGCAGERVDPLTLKASATARSRKAARSTS